MSSLENYYPSIIRLLDVQVIGPYLVKRGVLSSQDYYDNYVGPLQKGETSNYKLSLKLTNKCLKKPKDFLEALEESLNSTNHANHQELLETLSAVDAIHVIKKKNLAHRAAHKVKKRVFSKQKSAVDILMAEQSSKSHQMMENGYHNNSDNSSTSGIAVGEISDTKNRWCSMPLNASCSSLDTSSTCANQQLHGLNYSPLNMCHQDRTFRNSIGCIDQLYQTSNQSSPTFSKKFHQLSTPFLHSITTKGNETDDKDLQQLHKQFKLENKSAKGKDMFYEETMKKLQSECDVLRGQVKELEWLKEREALQRQTIETLTAENKNLNEQLAQLQVEIARSELGNSLQCLQSKVEIMTVQVESNLDSKKEKIAHVETQNKDLQKQITELKLTLSQQQTQTTLDHSKHQQEIEKYQQKCEQMESHVQEKDTKLSNIEGKMENTLENLQQIQEILANLNKKEESEDDTSSLNQDTRNIAEVTIRKNGIECFKQQLILECSKQDLVDIIEAHIEQIETLHQVLYSYHCKIGKLQLKLKCII
ncbi:putative leucine-rich repeat-containing protein DDB_G0290503 [Dysidea avara]|uniref:putative leucine-rich repeat-containing protein DDB_G0290503 n=1 Tax=Dysidea avara TaxID=196820 RepID=UPI00331B5C7D